MMTAMSGAHSQVCSFTGIYFGLNYSVARGGKGTTEMAGRAVPEHKHHFSLALGREDKHRAIYVLLVSFPRSSQIVTCQGPLEAACTMPEQPQKRQERGGSRARLQARILVAQVGLQQKTLRGCFLSWQVNETVAWFLSVCVCVPRRCSRCRSHPNPVRRLAGKSLIHFASSLHSFHSQMVFTSNTVDQICEAFDASQLVDAGRLLENACLQDRINALDAPVKQCVCRQD